MSMDQTELELLRGALDDPVSAPPGDLHVALRDFGWQDLLVEDPAVAVEVLFRLQGDRLTRETMLDEVVLSAFDPAGVALASAVAFPVPGQDLSSNYDHDGVRVA